MNGKAVGIIVLMLVVIAAVVLVALYYSGYWNANQQSGQVTTINYGGGSNLTGGNGTLGNNNGSYPYGRGK